MLCGKDNNIKEKVQDSRRTKKRLYHWKEEGSAVTSHINLMRRQRSGQRSHVWAVIRVLRGRGQVTQTRDSRLKK